MKKTISVLLSVIIALSCMGVGIVANASTPWIDNKETGERYYRYDFDNGDSFVVKVYFHKCFDYMRTAGSSYESRYKDRYGSEEYYLLKDGKYFKDCLTNKSQLIEYLKNLQKA